MSLLNNDREQYSTGSIVKKLIAEYNKRKKIVSEEYDPGFAKSKELTREVTPQEAKKLLDVIRNQGGPKDTLPYSLGGVEGTIDKVFESELAMVAAGNKPQKLKSFWIARDASADDAFSESNMPLNKIIDDIVGRKDIDPRKPMTQKEIDNELDKMTKRGDFKSGGLLQDDNLRYGMKDGGPGIEALRKEAPEVVERMGYQDGKNVVASLNSNPKTKMFGIETAINEAMLDLEDAQKNNDASAVKTIGARINSLDKARIELLNSLPENRIERSIGGVIKKLTEKIMKPKGSLLDEGAESIRIANLESFTYDDAVRAFRDKDMTMSEINQTLQAAGYPQKDVQEFTRELGSMVGKPKPSLAKDAVKKADSKKLDEMFNAKMSQEEIDEALDRLTGRGDFADGGIVPDDREQYGVGSIVKKALELKGVQKNVPGADALYDYIEFKQKFPKKYKDQVKVAEDELEMLNKKQNEIRDKLDSTMSKEGLSFEEMLKNKDFKNLSKEFDKNGNRINNIRKELKELGINPREQFEDGGMVPDEQMEDEYLDFILDEALDSEEEDYLMSQLQDNDRLSEIFDKVIDVAQEFAGSGPVEGPGSGVSDSIPARLSDGEFVFTAKSVEEIGADNLMAMMKDAEMKADERQGLAEGGQPEEEETVVMPVEQPASQQDIRVTKTTVGTQASMQEEQDLIGDEVKKSMLRGSRNLG